MDVDGFLHITGRKESSSPQGQNVDPAVLEDRMQAHKPDRPDDGGPERVSLSSLPSSRSRSPALSALVGVPRGKAGTSVSELRDDLDLNAEIQAAVDDANAAVSKAESIRSWQLLDAVSLRNPA